MKAVIAWSAWALDRFERRCHLGPKIDTYGLSPPSLFLRRTSDVETFHAELADPTYRCAKPGIETRLWNTKEVTVIDPFASRLIFCQPIETR